MLIIVLIKVVTWSGGYGGGLYLRALCLSLLCERVQDDQTETDDAVATKGGQHSFEVGATDVGLQLESHNGKVANVVRTES